MLCTFHQDGKWMVCSNEGCGRRVRVHPTITDPDRYRYKCSSTNPAPPRNTTCPHLQDPSDESVLVFGAGCASNKVNGIKFSVWDCALHGKCVTASKGYLKKEGISLCHSCSDHPRNQAK